MGRFRDALRHAFAIPKAQECAPNDAQRHVVDKVCREIARRRLTTPALMLLEMSRPLNFVSAQAMHFFQPILAILTDTRGYEEFAAFLEHRGSIEYLCRRLEHFEGVCERGAAKQSDSGNSLQTGDDRDAGY
jgi:hypothetical protein